LAHLKQEDREAVLEALYIRYGEFRQKTARDVCKNFGVSLVVRPELKPTQAFLFAKGKVVIQIPCTEPDVHSEFLIWHELAHLTTYWKFNRMYPPYCHWIAEMWCDAFAFANVLGRFGLEMSKDEFLGFSRNDAAIDNEKSLHVETIKSLEGYFRKPVILPELSEFVTLCRILEYQFTIPQVQLQIFRSESLSALST